VARSLAFWLENSKSIGDKNTKVELHFNFWSLYNGSTNYLDIGVKFSDVGHFDSLNFYLPFKKEQIEYKYDLGKKVCEHPVLVSAIFNAHATNRAHNDKKDFWDISFSTDHEASPLRFFTQISESSGPLNGTKVEALPQENGESGCILTFPKEGLFDDLKDDSDNYFRFRIILKGNAHESISQTYKSKDSIITSHFEKIEMVDFRVNETRNLPEPIRSKLNQYPHIVRVHFFLIREANSEYKMSHSQYHRCRVLENDLWNKYLEQDDSAKKDQNQMLIYHWKSDKKEKEGIDHFSAFAKFSRRNVTKTNIFGIVAVLVILSVASGLIANFIWSLPGGQVQSCSVTEEVIASSPDRKSGEASNTSSDKESTDKLTMAPDTKALAGKEKQGGEQQ
tara:strand:- start:811 stop:1989 length:1179 start_codon:yes stop_codon:yes gene_type:complete